METRVRCGRRAGALGLVVVAAMVPLALSGFGAARPGSPGGARASSAVRLFVTPDDFVDDSKGPLLTGGRDRLGVARIGCVTPGSAFLHAPEGSVSAGDAVDLTGVGTFHSGDDLSSVTATEVF